MTTAWNEVIERYRRLHDLSRPDLARMIDMSAEAIEKYERTTTKPSLKAAEALDAALNAGGAILAACGYTPPTDWAAEMATLRSQVAELTETVRRLTAIAEDLQRRIPPAD